MRKLKLAIFISGRGSNMTAIVDAAKAPDYPATPILIISNKASAAGLEFARRNGIATHAEDHKPYKGDREAFERAIHAHLVDHEIEIIALAGFMRVLSPWFVRQWQGRLINIHPSLLPKYKGLNTHNRALEAGDSHAGCSVHWVNEGVDDGDVIAQSSVPILPNDDEQALSRRVLTVEHSLYPRALAYACQILGR